MQYSIMPILLSCLWKPKTLHEYSDIFGYIRIYTYYFLYYYYSFTQLSNNAQNIIARIFFCLHLAFFVGGRWEATSSIKGAPSIDQLGRKICCCFHRARECAQNKSVHSKRTREACTHLSHNNQRLPARGRSSSAGCHCFYGDQSDHQGLFVYFCLKLCTLSN